MKRLVNVGSHKDCMIFRIRDRSFFIRWGGLVGFGGGAMRKKMAFEGGPSQKNKGKRGGHVKYFSKTLKKNCYRINIEGRIQIYYKLSFCFKKIFGDKKHL